jgi:hypothetical protein
MLRLEAGATLSANSWQNTGASRDVNYAYFTGVMVRHIPTLV